MERLVKKKNGVYHLGNVFGCSDYEIMQSALELLYEYEELGLSPAEIAELQRELEITRKELDGVIVRSSGIKVEEIKGRRLTGRDKMKGTAYFKKCFEGPCRGFGCTTNNCELSEQVCEKLCEFEDREEKLWQGK